MIKVERTFPAPPSLAVEAQKASGSYREPDVIEQLVHDFHGKCYLCNMDKLTDIQVEHLRPHCGGQNQALKFDWHNLFLSCPHCNSVKNKAMYNEIIDCCVVDPEEFLDFICTESTASVSPKEDGQDVQATAQLLTEIFNANNTGIRTYQAEIRIKKLLEEMNHLYTNLKKYSENRQNRQRRILRALLKKESPFVAFKRAYIRRNEHIYSEFLEYTNN